MQEVVSTTDTRSNFVRKVEADRGIAGAVRRQEFLLEAYADIQGQTMANRPRVLSIEAVVIAGGNPIRVDSIRDGEVACSSSADSVGRDDGCARCAARNSGHIRIPPEQVDQGRIASLKNVVEKAVEAIAHFKVMLAPF